MTTAATNTTTINTIATNLQNSNYKVRPNCNIRKSK